MSEAHQVKEVLGVQATEDGKQMLVGFKTASEEEVALALDGDSVWETLDCFIEATSLKPFVKGTKLSESMAFATDWFELGKIDDSKDLALTLVREKAHVTFRLTSEMAERLAETIAVILGKKFPAQPADSPAAANPSAPNPLN